MPAGLKGWLLGGLALAGVAAAQEPVVLVLGDSLSSGYGIALERGWVRLLAHRLAERGAPHRVVNASIAGDTTRGGLARAAQALDAHRPRVLVLELGGNDGLRGIPVDETRRSLEGIIRLAAEREVQVLLVGIRLPPNYGAAYTQGFEALYPRLAREQGVPLVPFLLEGVADRPELMQADGIHPREEAQAQLLETVWGGLAPLLGLAP
jgi:acyl-CoA thioesterase-1